MALVKQILNFQQCGFLILLIIKAAILWLVHSGTYNAHILITSSDLQYTCLVYTRIKTEPPTVICMIPSDQTTNPSSYLCDDEGLEVIILMGTFCQYLATKGIIMGEVLAVTCLKGLKGNFLVLKQCVVLLCLLIFS